MFCTEPHCLVRESRIISGNITANLVAFLFFAPNEDKKLQQN